MIRKIDRIILINVAVCHGMNKKQIPILKKYCKLQVNP